MKKKFMLKKTIVIIMISIILIFIILALFLIPKIMKTKKLEEQISLGTNYLSELEYEKAVDAYLNVIAIDSKYISAYLTLADIYIDNEDYNRAEEILVKAENEFGFGIEEIEEKQKEVEERQQKKEVVILTPTSMPIVTGIDMFGKTVILGKYKGLELDNISQEILDEEIETMLESYVQLVEVERAAIEGDTLNINYIGKLNGITFDGGTDISEEGTNLTLGSGQFIDGFEDGLIGSVAGEVRDLYLRFPESYENNPELAGKNVVFTVTVNKVQELVVPELTDEFIIEHTEYVSTEEYIKQLRNELNKKNYYEQITKLLMDSSKVIEYPKDEVKVEKEKIMEYYISYAEYYASFFGFDTETALASFFGLNSIIELEKYAEKQAQETIKNRLIFEEIASVEEIEVSVEEYSKRILEYAVSYDYDDIVTFEKDYGKEEIEKMILLDIVMEFILDQSIIKD